MKIGQILAGALCAFMAGFAITHGVRGTTSFDDGLVIGVGAVNVFFAVMAIVNGKKT